TRDERVCNRDTVIGAEREIRSGSRTLVPGSCGPRLGFSFPCFSNGCRKLSQDTNAEVLLQSANNCPEVRKIYTFLLRRELPTLIPAEEMSMLDASFQGSN
ncbi:hypothetical protein CBL_21022, partial [Carabus blaptoides fortunei]